MKYIIFDLDDTVLYKGECSDRTLNTLEECRKLGHKIVFNTARSKNHSFKYLEMFRPDYAILCGGANILDKDFNTIYGAVIDVDTLNKIKNEIYPYCDGFSCEATDGMYTDTKNYKGQPNTYFDFNNDFFKDCYKIVLNCKDFAKIEEISLKYDLEHTHYLGGTWHRLTKRNITKWSGVEKLIELTNGDLKDTICFGDDIGDLEMILKAGIGVALKNSMPDVLSKAPIISEYSVEEDGVARFLEREILKWNK